MYVLQLKRNTNVETWGVVSLYYEDIGGIMQYQGTNVNKLNLHTSIDATYMDISEQFYTVLYSKLLDAWYIPAAQKNITNPTKPIEYWIHQYVKHGVSCNLTFMEYYKKILLCLQQVPTDINKLHVKVKYNTTWQIKLQ